VLLVAASNSACRVKHSFPFAREWTQNEPLKQYAAVGVSLPHLRMETDPVSEMLCSLVFLEYGTMDKVQKPSNSNMLLV
jgi:hypothetical protein